MAGNGVKLRSAYEHLRDDKRWGELLNATFPNVIDHSNWECYGIERDGNPMVVWCYHSYLDVPNKRLSSLEAEMTIKAFNRRWASKNTIALMLALFFENNLYNRLTALIQSDNRQAVKLVKLAGFTLEGIIRKPDGIKDILQYSLLKEEWEKGKFYGRYN